MLQAFGFERVGVLMGDLYFLNPRPAPGEEGAERGVRLEVRILDKGELQGSIYSAQPIAVGRPVWRVDLLESVDSEPGSLDRAHHHPAFRGWEPGKRDYVPELAADPLPWVGARLADLDGLLAGAGLGPTDVAAADAEALRAAVPEILAGLGRLLDGVKAGELGRPPGDEPVDAARVGWL
ncbi:MAG: hypothetical protein ABR511_04060 [Acidimicrobiales bacterium]